MDKEKMVEKLIINLEKLFNLLSVDNLINLENISFNDLTSSMERKNKKREY